MKRPHLFRVDAQIETFTVWIERARADGLRIGWLGLAEPPLPARVEDIVSSGVAQCVIAGRQRTLAARARSGPPVLEDLLRQYFLGCHVVLIHGDIDLPTLRSGATGWQLAGTDGRIRSLDDGELLRLLQRPAPSGRSG